MKKTIFITILSILLSITLNAQPVTLDPTFGQNGMTQLPFDESYFLFDFDKSGNIIAVGVNDDWYNLNYLTIVKTNADGIIDKNFGTNGVVQLGFNSIEMYVFKITNENKMFIYASAVFDGRRDYFLMQLSEDGSFDETYGDSGIIVLDYGYNLLNFETDDFILLTSGSSIRKYNYNGEIDQNFGNNGMLYLTDGEGFRILPKVAKILKDQSILIAGSGYNEPWVELALCKLTTDGKFVDNFANKGIWRMDIIDDPYYYDDGITTEYFSKIIEDSMGNLILLGTIEIDYGTFGPQHDERILPLYVCSLNSDGILNSNFGTDGFFYHYYNGSVPSVQNILPYENKYLIGYQRNKIIGMNDNGILDTSFNNTGEFIFDISTNDRFHTIKHQGDNKLILAVFRLESYPTFRMFLARLNISPEVSIISNPYLDNSITIFPNPTKDYLYFNNEIKFEIMDTQGRVLLKSEKPVQSVNVSHLKAGVYFIKTANGTNIQTQKIIKQ